MEQAPTGFKDSEQSALTLGQRLELLLANDLAGENPLHCAAKYGNPDIWKAFVAAGLFSKFKLKIDAAPGRWNITPLMEAAAAGNADAVKALLDEGADPRMKSWHDATALHAWCAGSAHPEITQAILDAARKKIADHGKRYSYQETAFKRFLNESSGLAVGGHAPLQLLFFADSLDNARESAKLLQDAGAKPFTWDNAQLLALSAKDYYRLYQKEEKSGMRPIHPELLDLFPNLEELAISYSDNLKQLPEDLPKQLKTLILHCCTGIRQTPETLAERLESLQLTYCPNIEQLTPLPATLTELRLRGCSGIKQLPDSLPERLTDIDLEDCSGLKRLPQQLLDKAQRMKELKELGRGWEIKRQMGIEGISLNVTGCTKLENIPDHCPPYFVVTLSPYRR
jgi:hypothetical protein